MEGGIATPCVVTAPGCGPGTVRHEPAHFIDIMATVCDLTGTVYPTEREGRVVTPLEGESFVPALAGGTWTRRGPLFWEHEGNRAVRRGEWKLVSRHPGSWELYNMSEDRTELHDRGAGDASRMRKIAGMWQQWADRCGVVPWERILPLLGPGYHAWLETAPASIRPRPATGPPAL